VVFRAEVVSTLESALESAVRVGWAEVHLVLCVSIRSAEDMRCHIGKQDTWACGLDEA
jgi:hypothetical protein